MTFPAEKLQQLVDWVWKNPYSDFYRELWGRAGITEKPRIQTKKEWETLPTMSRADLLERDNPSERLFVPMEEVLVLRTTSGTSTGKPLLFWNNAFPRDYSWYREAGGNTAMIFSAYQNFARVAIAARRCGLETISGDPHDLPRSALLTKKADVDTLVITPTLAGVFAPYLMQAGVIDSIRVLVLWGEQCSQSAYALLQSTYPKARILSEYAFAELNYIGAQSSDLCENSHNTFHVQEEDVFFETVDGECAATTLQIPHAMPLIRYRNGDEVSFPEELCQCGEVSERLKVHGRIRGDFLRIAGGELRTEEIDRVLLPFLGTRIEPLYRMEVYVEDPSADGKTSHRMRLLVIAKDTPRDRQELVAAQIKEVLLSVRMTSRLYLKDAVASGLVHGVAVVFVENLPVGTKNKRLVLTDTIEV